MKTSSGRSLNDRPVVQSELVSILIRFRMKKFAIAADINKMYRQILMHPNNTQFQRIFWRNTPAEELKVYEILTVNFGTASAPYLATRCIKQTGLEVQNSTLWPVLHYSTISMLMIASQEEIHLKKLSYFDNN